MARYPGGCQKYTTRGRRGSVYIKNVIANDHVWVGDYTTYSDLRDGTRFYDQNILYHRNQCPLIIGRYCELASGVTFIMYGANHAMDGLTTYNFVLQAWRREGLQQKKPYKGPTVVGNDVWIGYKATIMPSITIGDGAIVGAHSVVTKDVEPYTIVGGNPAKVLRTRFSDDVRRNLMTARWWYWPVDKVVIAVPRLMTLDAEYVAAEAQQAYEKRSSLKKAFTATAIIITKNAAVDLKFLLASLTRQSCLFDEIVIVDSGVQRSDEDKKVAEQLELLIDWGASIIYEHTSAQDRAAKLWQGVQLATKDVVAFFEDDCVVGDQYLEYVLRGFIDNQECDATMGRVVQNRPKWWRRWYQKLFELPSQLSQTILTGPACYKRTQLRKEHFDVRLDLCPAWQDRVLALNFQNKSWYTSQAYVYRTNSPVKQVSYVQKHEREMIGYVSFVRWYGKKEGIGKLGFIWGLLGMIGQALIVLFISRNSARLRACWRGWRAARKA